MPVPTKSLHITATNSNKTKSDDVGENKSKESTLSGIMGDFLEDKPEPPKAGPRFISEEDKIINEKLKRLSII